MRYTHVQLENRDGITLMEVLIAIGILAVGLSSVAALMPAAGSQAKKAVIADRAASMAENALADAIAIGLTRQANLVSGTTRIVFDPVGDPLIAGMTFQNTTNHGMFGGGTVLTSGSGVQKLFGQNRDDLVYNEPASEDALPTNAFFDGTRGFLGRTSCVWLLESLNSTVDLVDSESARLSAVLFHERDQSLADEAVFNGGGTATIDGNGLITWTGPLPDGKTSKQIFRPGTVIVRHNPFVNALNLTSPAAYVLRAAPGSPSGGLYAIADDSRLTQFSVGTTSDPVSILVGSVGLAQKIVTLEGNSEYTLSDERKVTP